MIDGFAREPSVVAGGHLHLHVATDAPRFRVEFHRWGRSFAPVAMSGWLDGRPAPAHLPDQDWSRDGAGLDGEDLGGWAGYEFDVPREWPSGVYVAVLREGDGRTRAPLRDGDARHGRALFVVRSAAPGTRAAVLYKLPLFTYHAYNQVSDRHWTPARGDGGWCLYSDFDPLPVPTPLSVSYRRPGGGSGGTPYDFIGPDPFDATPRQTFAHWDARAVAWLEASGHAVDFCTDLDLHRDGGSGALLEPYRLLLSFGHDEYWSGAMRDGVERWVARGGNAAFFGGNTSWWRIVFDDAGIAFRRAGRWSAQGRPENAMTGVSFRNGGERPVGAPAAPVGFAVQHADHWVYEGAGVRDGELFGAGPREHLVGYECDGANFERGALAAGGPAVPAADDGTPADFAILGVGDVARAGWGQGNAAATLGVREGRGTVFTAATTDWARLLHPRAHPVVERITHNVLERLTQPRP